MAKVTKAHIEARKDAIMNAAGRMFVRKGVGAATMQEIAAEADLSAGAIYRYFPSKEDLLRAVCGGAVDTTREMFDRAAATTHSPRAALHEIGTAAWAKLREPDSRQDIILNLESTLAAVRDPERAGDGARDVQRALIEMLASLIREAQAAEEVDPETDAPALAATLLACHLGSGLLALQLGDELDTSAIHDVVTQLLDGLAPTASRAR